MTSISADREGEGGGPIEEKQKEKLVTSNT